MSLDDSVGWKGCSNHRFTVKSAYELRLGPTNGEPDKVWKIIHKFCGLVKVFMWFAYCRCLMTNAERVRQPKKFNSSAIDPWSVFEIITMGKKAKNITGTKASVKESGSSWSPAMDGIPEPSSVEQARHGSSVEVLRAQTVEGFQGNMSC
ncbi:hypothetical protein V6N11_076118 [Hibiscus sabdariffa]|uniref:Uncharacterized protein n=1 Tax=Hibiscus sabdariffa TaxID=183260 RepID=A0ABR2Q5B1_9ROSI